MTNEMNRTINILCAALAVALGTWTSAMAQEGEAERVVVREKVDNFFEAEYEVLKSDTTMRDGDYKLFYNGFVIEKGRYSGGVKSGVWEYSNMQKIVEFRYDHTAKRATYMVPRIGYKYDAKNHPCTFIGSPLVPFCFVHSRCYYPKAEANNKSGGQVILRLNINKLGRMTGYIIKYSSSPNFTTVVKKAADAIPRDEWRWEPELKNGQKVAGYHEINIVFDNE